MEAFCKVTKKVMIISSFIIFVGMKLHANIMDQENEQRAFKKYAFMLLWHINRKIRVLKVFPNLCSFCTVSTPVSIVYAMKKFFLQNPFL